MRTNPSIDTRDRILDAAVEVVAQRGYSAASVQEIVDRSGTSKGSFYFHFHGKERMVMVLVDRMSDRLLKKIHGSIRNQPTPVHRVAAGIEVLMATFGRQRKVAQVLLLNVMGHGRAVDKKFLPLRDRFTELIQQELDAAVAQGQIAPQDTALLSRMWVGSLHEVIMRWLLGEPTHLTDATPALRSALLRSIGVDPAAVQT